MNTRTAKLVPGTRRVNLSAYDLRAVEDVKIGDFLIDTLRLVEFKVTTITTLDDAVVFNGTVKRQRGFKQIVAPRA